MRILGIDPGLATAGYGVLACEGGVWRWHGHGAFGAPAGPSHALRVAEVGRDVDAILSRLDWGVVEPTAIERMIYPKATANALAAYDGRGAIVAALGRWGLDPQVFSADEWVGHLGLSFKRGTERTVRKRAIAVEVARLLRMDAIPTPSHAADALGIACAHVIRLGGRFA